MNSQVLIIVAVMLFLVAGLWVKNNKPSTIEVFSTKQNKLSWFVTAAGISMTFVGGAALLNMASFGYRYKWYTLIDPLAFIIGILISVRFVKYYRNNKGVTIAQLLSGSNKRLSLYIGIVSSIVFLLVISAQTVAFSKLLSPYFPAVDPSLLMIIPSGIILLYVFLGGFSAVTNTDVLQLFLIFIFLLFPTGYYLITHHTGLSFEGGMKATYSPMPADLILYLVIFGLFIPVSQDINIRAKSAKDERHARLGIIWGGIFYCLIIIACMFIGITLAEHKVIIPDTEQTFSTFFKEYYPLFGIFPVLAGMAAIWSTLDTYLVNGISAVAQDILKKTRYFKELNERKLIIISGLIVFLLAIFTGLYVNKVLYLILTALLIYISVLIPVVIAKRIRMDDNMIFLFSVSTAVAILLCEVLKLEIMLKPLLYPVTAVLIMLAGRYVQHMIHTKKT